MRFNSGERMLPTEEAIYHRLGGDERKVFLEEGTASVNLSEGELRALVKEYEEECEWLLRRQRQQELMAFLGD